MNTTGLVSGNPPAAKSHAYAAALVLIGCLFPLPIVAMIVTTAIYVAPLSPALSAILPQWIALSWIACLAGFVLTLFLWLLFALPFTGFASAENASPVSGSHLKNHFLAVRAAFTALLAMQNHGSSLPNERTSGYHIASEQVRSYLSEIEQLLDLRDMRWMAGTGYLHAWSLVHRAEEAMFALEPREEVIREALYDELCLEGSPIDARSLELNKLRTAVMNLSASATIYLDSSPGNAGSGGRSSVTESDAQHLAPANPADDTINGTPKVTDLGNAASAGEPPVPAADAGHAPTDRTAIAPAVAVGERPMAIAPGPGSAAAGGAVVRDASPAIGSEKPEMYSMTELEARVVLRDVRRTLNEFRDGLWEGLVTLRNQLMGTTLIAGVTTYVLLCFAIIAGAPPASIMGATAFYLVGALVGLFGRMNAETKIEKSSNDYGLTLARIILTPVLGGLAAVGGILLTAMLSLTLLKSPAAQPGNLQLGLADIYNLSRNELGIAIAAVFGYTPNLIVNVLSDKATTITSQLQNTSASDQGNKVRS